MERHRDSDPRLGRESLGGWTEEPQEMPARPPHWRPLLKWRRWHLPPKTRKTELSGENTPSPKTAHVQPSNTVTRSHMLRGDLHRQLSSIPRDRAPADLANSPA